MPNKPAIAKAGRTIDWRAVEADYRAGLAVLAVARSHGISPSSIYRRASRHRWQGRPATTPAGPGPQPKAGPAPPGTAADELARLRALAAKLRDRLERVFDGKRPYGIALGARESPATLLLKLCQITEKIIAMERRLAGAGAPSPSQLNEQDRDILDRFKRRYGVG